MTFFLGNKKNDAKAQEQSIVTGPQDANKTFNATAIRKSLEVLGVCVENREDQKINKKFVYSFVAAFGDGHKHADWLDECKVYLCDALKDSTLQKHYLLHAATKQYLALDIAIGLLFSNKQSINSLDVATILNTIDHGTGKYVGELDRTLQLRRQNPSPQAGEIIQAAQKSKQKQSKEALLRILPLDQLAGRELSIYQLITETAKEDQKSLMERFFFNQASSTNFSNLVGAINAEHRTTLPNLFQFMESIYSPAELQQKALQLEIAGDGNTIFGSVLRIPAGEQRLQYLIDKSPIHNFIPYALFDKQCGVIPQKILSAQDAVSLLKKLNELHPNNVFILEAIGRVQKDYNITF